MYYEVVQLLFTGVFSMWTVVAHAVKAQNLTEVENWKIEHVCLNLMFPLLAGAHANQCTHHIFENFNDHARHEGPNDSHGSSMDSFAYHSYIQGQGNHKYKCKYSSYLG